MNILYLTYNSVMTLGILQSQVATLLKLLSTKYRNEFYFTLITVERWKDYRNQAMKSAFRQEMEKNGIRVIIIPKFMPEMLHRERHGVFLQFFLFWLDLKLLSLVTMYASIRYRIQVIHARSYVPGIIAVFCKWFLRKKFIFDPRGLIPEELLLAQGWSETSSKYRVWKRIEKMVLKNVDTVFVLSKPFAEHYQKIIPSLQPIITPCCVDIDQFVYDENKRRELRKRFELKDKLVVVFTVGSFVPYQLLDGGIKLFQQVHKLQPNAKLLLLTPDKDQIESYLTNKSEIRNLQSEIMIFSPSFQEMPEYLLRADVALLVRVPSIISEVASPVKFAEYLACGVPVIAYPNIGDTRQITEQEQVGIVVDPNNNELTEQQLQQFLPLLGHHTEIATRCRTTATKYFSWENYLDLYYKTYTT